MSVIEVPFLIVFSANRFLSIMTDAKNEFPNQGLDTFFMQVEITVFFFRGITALHIFEFIFILTIHYI